MCLFLIQAIESHRCHADFYEGQSTTLWVVNAYYPYLIIKDNKYVFLSQTFSLISLNFLITNTLLSIALLILLVSELHIHLLPLLFSNNSVSTQTFNISYFSEYPCQPICLSS